MPLTQAQIAQREQSLRTRSYSTLSELAGIEPPELGIQTGWPDIDKLTGGLQPNRLNEFVGYTSHGKTSGMATVIINNLERDLLMLFASVDDSRESLLWKFLSMRHGITIEEVMKQSRAWRIEKSQELERNLVVHGTDNMSRVDVARIIDNMQDDYGRNVDLVCFDYLGLLAESNNESNIPQGATAFKEIVRAFPETTFILGHQCNRGAIRDIDQGLHSGHVMFGGVKECDGVMIGFRRRLDTEDLSEEEANHELHVPTTNISVMRNKVNGKRSVQMGHRYAIDTTTSMIRELTREERRHNVVSMEDLKLKRMQ